MESKLPEEIKDLRKRLESLERLDGRWLVKVAELSRSFYEHENRTWGQGVHRITEGCRFCKGLLKYTTLETVGRKGLKGEVSMIYCPVCGREL